MISDDNFSINNLPKFATPVGYKFLLAKDGRSPDECLECNMVGIVPGKNLIIRDEIAGKFYLFDNLDHYEWYYYEYLHGDFLTHEVILGHFPQRPKWDIDGGDVDSFDEIVELIGLQFDELYGVKPEFVICDSSNEDKFSRHIIVANYAFANSTEADHFSQLLRPNTVPIDNIIDWGVNKPVQNFRTVDSVKGGRRKQVISGPFDSAWITLCGECDLLPRLSGDSGTIVQNYTGGDIADDTVAKIVGVIDGQTWSFNRVDGNMVVFDRLRASHCEICAREHTRVGMYVCIFADGAKQFCFRDMEKPKRFINLLQFDKCDGEIKDEQYHIEINQEFIKIDCDMEVLIDMLMAGQMSRADMFVKYNKHYIKITDMVLSAGYMFDNNTALWVYCTRDYILPIINKFLCKMRDICLEYLNKKLKLAGENVKLLLEKKMTLLVKMMEKFMSTREVRDIFTQAKSGLSDRNFEISKNSEKKLLPVRGKKIIDLTTGEVRVRTFNDNFTFECPFEPVENISEKVEKYMLDLMDGRLDLVNYFQKVLGYCITGETNEKKLFIFYGPKGNNGKSKLLHLLSALINDFYRTVSHTVFIKSDSDNRHENAHTSHLMPIVGARIIAISELGENERLNDKQIKQLTGEDNLSLRACGARETITYRPICKPIIISNHLPEFNIRDDAMRTRVVYIPFDAKFSVNPQIGERLADPKIIEELQGDLLGHFGSWVIKGAIKYYAEGLGINPLIQQFTENANEEMDSVRTFIREKCVADETGNVKASDAYDIYKRWCIENGRRAETLRNFGVTMSLTFQKMRRNVGFVYKMVIN